MSLWFPLTLLSAFFLATSDALTKKAVHGHNEYLVTLVRIFPTLPLFLIPLLFIDIPRLPPEFYLCIVAALPMEAVAIFLYTKALKLSPLSLTLPLLSLTPLLLLVVPFLLLGERISAAGSAGILLIAIGGYLLNAKKGEQGTLAPLKALAREKGALCMLCVAAIYSVTSTLGKRAIELSSPLLFAAIYLPLLVAAITPVALYKGRGELAQMAGNGTIRASLLPALCYALQVVTHVYAISLTNVAYMIAVKRISLLFGVLYGHYLFQERGGIVATIVMLVGVFLIVTGG